MKELSPPQVYEGEGWKRWIFQLWVRAAQQDHAGDTIAGQVFGN